MKSKRELLTKSINKRNIKPLPQDDINTYLKENNTKSNNFSSTSTNATKHQQLFNKYQLSEDFVEIKIPTPYPQNHYMLIEDEALLNSQYTQILNDKFPPRKYLKHNLTSWNKFNKKKSNKDLHVKFLNPKINFEDGNLKRIKNCIEEIESEKINNIEEAIDIIEKLKRKIVEYEITNNKNIETSIQHINCLKDENEFFKYKLIENYEKFNFICDKYNIDESDINNIDEILILPFRKKWQKKNLFHTLIYKTEKIKKFRMKFFNFQKFKKNVIKLKAILGLERNSMNNKYKKKFEIRKKMNMKKKCFEYIRYNIFLQKLTEKFKSIKRTVNIMVYMKELKLNVGYSKYHRSLKNKAFLKYFQIQAMKALKILKINAQIRKEEKIEISKKNLELFNRENDISFDINKLQNIHKPSYTTYLMTRQRFYKSDKYKALKKMKEIYEKFSSLNNFSVVSYSIASKSNKKLIMKIFFSKWKQNSNSKSKKIAFEFIFRKYFLKLFFSKLRKILSYDNSEIIKRIKFFKIFMHKFFKNVISKIILKRKAEKFSRNNIKHIHLKSTINKMLRISFEDPKIRYKRVHRKFQIVSFFDIIKTNIKHKKNKAQSIKIFKKHKSKLIDRNVRIFKKSFFDKAYKIISYNKRQNYLINFIHNKNIFTKYLNNLRIITLITKIKKSSKYSHRMLSDLKIIIKEKSQMIHKIEIEKSELNSQLDKLINRNNSLNEENLTLNKKVEESEIKIEKDNIKFKELFKQNVNDIKNLQELLQKNEALLLESIQREKKLQHKYCIDIQNAIKLNKKLNEIISKKNNEIADIKVKQHHVDVNNIKEHNKLYKENASLLDDYAKIIEIKEKERRHADDEKRKINEDAFNRIGRIDDERMKFDYKSKFLEKENKFLLSELITEIKKDK